MLEQTFIEGGPSGERDDVVVMRDTKAVARSVRADEPTTQEGWVERELQVGHLLVRSHVYEMNDHHYRFDLTHPASGQHTSGSGPDITTVYDTMNRILAEWFPEATHAGTDLKMINDP